METSTEQQSLTSPIPPTFLQEIALFIQQMPAWLFALLSLMVVFVLYQIVGGLIIFLFFGTNVTASNVEAVRWATMLGQIIFLLAPTILLAKLRFPHVENVFRFGGINLKEILLVLLAVFSLQQLLQGYMIVQESIPVSFPPYVQQLIDRMKEMMEQMYTMLTAAHSIPEFLFVVIVIAATPAVCEELLFRGLIQRTLEETDSLINPTPREMKRRGLTAAIVAGIVFGLYHLNPFSFVALAGLGVYFGFVVYRTQNIVTSVVAHFFNNFIACLAIYLHLNENLLFIPEAEQATASMLITSMSVSALVFVAATYYLVRVTEQPATT